MRIRSPGVGAAGTLESGLVPSLAFGVALAGRVGLASEVSGFYPELKLLLGQTQSRVTRPLATVDVTKLALTLAGCPYAVSVVSTTTVRPCIGYEVGRVQARARLDAAPVRNVLWSSLALGVGAGQTILSTRLDVWAGARAHLVRPAYFVTADGEPVNLYRVPRWGFFSGISLTFGEM